MLSPGLRAFLVLWLVLLTGGPARAAVEAGALTDEQVLGSIQKGVDYLFSKQQKDGTWETKTEFSSRNPCVGGETALVVDALLHIGQSVPDPRLKHNSPQLAPAVNYLTNLQPDATYTAALQAMVLALLPPNEANTAALQRARAYLLAGTRQGGGHYYSVRQTLEKPGLYDHSNANYALLGLYTAAEAGQNLPLGYWQMYEAFWRKNQNKDGGWGYAPGRDRPDSTAPMTAAGIASLYLLKDFTDTEVRAEARVDKALEAGLEQLIKTYNPNTDNFYYLFSLERVGLASGLKLLNTQDWFRQGAANLLNRQRREGSWSTGPQTFWCTKINDSVCTSMALLFLARGRSPVLFNKLQYNGPWDARGHDDANLTAWAAKQFETPINWQSVNLQVEAEEWLDAPILLLTGSQDPKFSEAEVAKLRAFVEAGGMIFSTADEASQGFTTAVRKYAAKIADGRYEPRELPPDHPVYTLWSKVERPQGVRLLGLSNGVRELWIHAPSDLGATWQRRNHDLPAHWQIPANLYFYATGKASLSAKLASLAVPAAAITPARTIRLARLTYAGNADPEPGAWPRLAKLLRLQARTELQLSTVAIADLDVKTTPIAHLTGTTRFVLPEADKEKLRAFLAAGGTLLADACGGSGAFADSFLPLAKELLPAATAEEVPLGHAIFGAGGGVSADAVKLPGGEYRKFTQLKVGPSSTPHLVGFGQGNRYAIVFSPDDVTCGLLGTNTWGISGYTPRCAQALARNLLLYAGQGK